MKPSGLTPGNFSAPIFAAAASAMALRNVALDAAFYDLPGLTAEELRTLSNTRHEEGAILVAHPSGNRRIGVERYEDYRALRASPGKMLTQFAVAGVGSSDLGAAALARTLANVTGRPAGAVVAGFGAEDLVSEALGGFFLFGAANRARHARQTLRHRLGTMISELSPAGSALTPPLPHQFATPDVATLVRLMTDPDRRIDLLLGHSKGALTVAAALARVVRTNDPATIARLARAQVVTVGAVISFPPEIPWITQLIGAVDALGAVNSRFGLPHRMVPFAGHHLNTGLPMHLDLRSELEAVIGA